MIVQACSSTSADTMSIVSSACGRAIVERRLVIRVKLPLERSRFHGIRIHISNVVRRTGISKLLLLARLQLLIWAWRQTSLTQRHEHILMHVICPSLAVWVWVRPGLASEATSLVVILHTHDHGISTPQSVVYFRYVLERLRLIISASTLSSTWVSRRNRSWS